MTEKASRAAKPPARVELSVPQRALLGAGIGIGVAALLFALRGTDLVEKIELPLVDVRTRAFAGGSEPHPQIVVVEILDDDVRAVKRDVHVPWPWTLDFNASIFRLMQQAGVRAVLVDVLHLDRGAGLDDAAGEDEGTGEDKATREGEAVAAEEYAKAMKAIGRVALAMSLADHPQYEVPARVAVARDRLGPAGITPPPEAPARRGADLPVRRVAEGASILAFADVPRDADGGVRRAWTTARWGVRPVLSLPLATAALATGGAVAVSDRAVVVGTSRQATMPDGSFLLNFHGPAHAVYRRVPPSKILEWAIAVQEKKPLPDAAREALADKIVVWGKNLVGESDVVPSPMAGGHHGPYVQAVALDNLLAGDGRVRAARLANGLVLLLAAMAAAVVGMASRRRFVAGGAAAGLALAVVGLSVVAFAGGRSYDVFTPVLGILLGWSGALVSRLLTEGRYNRWLEGTFGRYLAPEVIESLKKDPSLLALGGVRRNITIFFSDVAGFTSLSEDLPPEDTVRLLNEYLTGHCAAVFAQGGMVDKFLGDGVMAFFGDPVPQTDHAVRACRAALAVMASLPALEPVWRGLGLEDFMVRIGLMSGEALVGNMGSRQRFDYTCMGDTVNLASRLEGANKAFGTRILLGPETYESSKAEVLAKPLADVVVVGREEPVLVAELLAVRAGADPALVAHAEAFERAREAAKRGDLEAARRALDEADRLRPGDGPVAWFRGVLSKLAAGSEPSPWSGRYVLSSK